MKGIVFGFTIVLRYAFLGAAAGAMFACQGAAHKPSPTDIPEGMVWIAGDGEDRPGFLMDATEVTTAAFGAFVTATGYVTEAEGFGWSGVFNTDSLGWLPVTGATWEYPQGPDSSAAAPNHPVTQISIRDAKTYADWAGKRLPTEEEWVWAASQGGEYPHFPWGHEMVPNGKYPGNWWQGPFPYEDNILDGFAGVAPVGSFFSAGNGLFDISGNVWEWTLTQKPNTEEYVIKGGSFLCSTSYCTGFDFRQRQFTPADSGLNHLGMRLVQ